MRRTSPCTAPLERSECLAPGSTGTIEFAGSICQCATHLQLARCRIKVRRTGPCMAPWERSGCLARGCTGTIGFAISVCQSATSGANAVAQVVRNYQCGFTAINSYQLLFGIHRSGREVGENTSLGLVQVWTFDKQAAEKAAELYSNFIAKNKETRIEKSIVITLGRITMVV